MCIYRVLVIAQVRCGRASPKILVGSLVQNVGKNVLHKLVGDAFVWRDNPADSFPSKGFDAGERGPGGVHRWAQLGSLNPWLSGPSSFSITTSASEMILRSR